MFDIELNEIDKAFRKYNYFANKDIIFAIYTAIKLQKPL